MGLPADFQTSPIPLTSRILFAHDWRDLAFLHWRIPPAVAAPFMPPGTRPDTFEGDTFVGLVPFELRSANFLGGPRVPYLGDFLETNVRLYSVDSQGRHGVVFRSLEASHLAVVLAARASVGLPYTWSRQRCTVSGSTRTWTSTRRWPRRGLRTSVTVEVGDRIAEPDPLTVFLTARWGMHAYRFGRTVWMPNQHEPWQFHHAHLVELRDQLVRAAGLPVVGAPDVATIFSAGVHTVFGEPEPL
jgi:uncharacterized protein YqjF (DUF2071 family)